MNKQFKIASAVLGTLILLSAGYYFGKSPLFEKKSSLSTQQNTSLKSVKSNNSDETTLSPTQGEDSEANSNSGKVQEIGADLKSIGYTLPENWEVKISEDNLFFKPSKGGGFLILKVYAYPTTVGRREFYCQVSKICITDTTYFTETTVGNISGYKANALDNSGDGVDYFGAKGNNFYIISSYNPPSPNDFEKGYELLIKSLVF